MERQARFGLNDYRMTFFKSFLDYYSLNNYFCSILLV